MELNAPIGVLTCKQLDSGEIILLDANAAVDTLLGIKCQAFIGKELSEVFTGEESVSLLQFCHDALSNSDACSADELSFTINKNLLPLQVISINAAKNCLVLVLKPIHYESMPNDLLLKQINVLEQQLKQRTEQLELVDKELQAFTYTVSHDLRSPLRGVDGWSLALLEDFGDSLNEKAHKYLNTIRSEASRMGILIEALLQLSRACRKPISYEEVNLSEIARIVLDKLQEQHPDRQVTTSVEPDMLVWGDKKMLEVVMENLLDNAWKFTGLIPEAQIKVGKTTKDGNTVYYVQDNGAGFEMAYAEKLFGAFQRMHKPTQFAGVGVGLAMAQRIILRHGGKIWAEAAVSEGATFYWTLRRNVHE
ncbi:MAG: ATP-binding protein [Candidatus Cloacimonetes bacterium]|nr:ATP-binding protein [Candidatus Cloacimonadota bacterium]